MDAPCRQRKRTWGGTLAATGWSCYARASASSPAPPPCEAAPATFASVCVGCCSDNVFESIVCRDTFLPCTFLVPVSRVVQIFFVVYSAIFNRVDGLFYSTPWKLEERTATIECVSSRRARSLIIARCSSFVDIGASIITLAARYVLSERTHALVNHGPRLAR